MVATLCFRYKGAKIYLYTGDKDATPTQMISKCRNNFNIQVDPKRIEFVFLNQRRWVEADRYPVMTLLGQSLGSVILGFEALLKFQPDIYLDTMGEFRHRLYQFYLTIFNLQATPSLIQSSSSSGSVKSPATLTTQPSAPTCCVECRTEPWRTTTKAT